MKASDKNRVRVKICGITNPEDAHFAIVCGADALGFVFHKGSPRYIAPKEAGKIVKALPPLVGAVGVFVNLKAEEVVKIASESLLDTVQLHGDEGPEYCRAISEIHRVVKAVRVRDEASIEGLDRYSFVSGLLLDSCSRDVYGGSGEQFDWSLARGVKGFGRVILAGGLNADNVVRAVREVRPYGVDVSSGVERAPGKKDHDKLLEFFSVLRGPGLINS